MKFSSLAIAILNSSAVVWALPNSPIKKRAARTSPPPGCISAGNGGTYATIHTALTAIGAGSSSGAACIFVYPGTYDNSAQVEIIYKGKLTLYGSTPKYVQHNLLCPTHLCPCAKYYTIVLHPKVQILSHLLAILALTMLEV